MDTYDSMSRSARRTKPAAPLRAFNELAREHNPCDWERHLRKVLRQLGFNHYLLSLSPTRPGLGNPLAGVITTFPRAWLDCYCGDGLLEIDPILKHCRQELVPMFWAQEGRRARGRTRHFWQRREEHGLRHGLSIPLRYEQLRGTLSVAFDGTDIQEDDGFANPAAARLFMLVPYVVSGLGRRLQAAHPSSQDLTPRELECLYWASAGKTSWEISHILTRSERTVDFHLLNARRKLGSVSRQQAVGAAAARGLLTGGLAY
ncbi:MULTISPECIES: LuxR family transcriptional regulator [unclassified Pseudomonas]|uniref:helix-turn-helix transcriptional regulator n=1 Tax=unclassified Pseudomonas TaxID=196821 RepID=UPI000BC97AD1|nr:MULTISPECIES: LuxR family transcriptional regulator [unclassified Pseudomonas]PVZ20401.1 LuxR family quorum-sensing transcriptional regulator LasR [Pseudomonas sp. URIL14HWK12:I12]PVZ27467.1 LuxR family quorum-sensing transcriptional regulator LasR [Pseudomonas sp. URIL14HWK12:I10]PVZ38356.1 LuxR family quorum-sensing transcriptional regulator LasR [Pseudomonas sp. URIL14HWK12:I11]SNZ03684.1 LuxR family transcriptional regulator, quorum-sensing transcription factor LasR [Pseudomonas sp. URIL